MIAPGAYRNKMNTTVRNKNREFEKLKRDLVKFASWYFQNEIPAKNYSYIFFSCKVMWQYDRYKFFYTYRIKSQVVSRLRLQEMICSQLDPKNLILMLVCCCCYATGEYSVVNAFVIFPE